MRVRHLCFALLVLVCSFAPGARAEGDARPWWHDAPSTPERFGVGIVSTDAEESALNLSPSGDRILFARSRVWFPASRIAAIFQVDRSGPGWAEAVPAAFSRGFSDVDPFITRDGSSIYFSSMRPADGRPRKDFDLWMTRPNGGGFAPSSNLGPTINSEADDLYPTLSGDGTLVFGSERAGGLGGWDLYVSTPSADGSHGAARNLGAPVNSAAWEYNPAIASDGSFLVFASLDRAGGVGAGDLWIARRTADGGFGVPQPLQAGVNTPADDYHPTLSPDDRTLFFIRRDASRGQAADFHWVSLEAALPNGGSRR